MLYERYGHSIIYNRGKVYVVGGCSKYITGQR